MRIGSCISSQLPLPSIYEKKNALVRIISCLFALVMAALAISYATYSFLTRKWRVEQIIPNLPKRASVIMKTDRENQRIEELKGLQNKWMSFLKKHPHLNRACQECLKRNQQYIASFPDSLPDGEDVYVHLNHLTRKRVILEAMRRELLYFLLSDSELRKVFIQCFNNAQPLDQEWLMQLLGRNITDFPEIVHDFYSGY